MIGKNLGQRLSNLSVGQKIGLGYVLALGITVSGTIAGFSGGEHYKQKTEDQEEHAREEVELLNHLQSRVLEVRIHQQRLIPVAQYPDKFQDEYAHLLQHEAEIKEIWAEIKAFLVDPHTEAGDLPLTEIPAFLRTYENVPQGYSQELAQRVKAIQNLNPSSLKEVEQAQKLILEFTNSDLALKFDGISDDLVSLIDEAYQNLEDAEMSQREADAVVEKIIIASTGASIAIATLLAALISRAITQPLAALTRVAQKSTEG